MYHTNKQFDTELDYLRSAVTRMAGLVERQFLRSIDAVRYSDLGMATQVLADEEEVNRMHVQTDLRCNMIIAKRQPAAVDLREIIAVLHMNNDLERIGDEAKKIAFKARDLQGRPLLVAAERLEHMTSVASEMLRASVDAFVRHDASLAEDISNRDHEVDRDRDALTADLVTMMSQDAGNAANALSLVFVVQSIERVGDHAKNIAEYVVNIVEGIDARHTTPAREQ